jgi:hypothetical protein
MQTTMLKYRARGHALATTLATTLATALLLTACGGGGNESGPADSLYLSFSLIRVGTPGNCVVGQGPEVHIYGGAPPYKLANSVPQAMVLSKAQVNNSGESFVVSFINGVCLIEAPITVEDTMGRLAQVKITNGS